MASGRGLATEVATPIRRCPMVDEVTPVTAALPCYWTAIDAGTCGASAAHVALHIERGAADAPAGSTVVARCAAND